MATIEERVKELDELYSKATMPDEYLRIWFLARQLDQELGNSRYPRELQLKAALTGLWARYYQAQKSVISPGDIDELYESVKTGIKWADEIENIELTINYRYLLSVIVGQLRKDPEEAAKIDKEMQRLVKDSKNIPLALRVINARGLNAIQKKEWPEAINIFSQVERDFREAFNLPEAWQHFANTLNNRSLARLNLSDGVKKWQEKRDLISSAIVDLRNAEELYMKVTPPPLKHIDGLENRLIMAAYRLLLTERFIGEVEIGNKIREAFEAKNREEAKRLIFALKELKVEKWDKIEGDVPGDTMTFIGSIQIGLRMASEFLEQHK